MPRIALAGPSELVIGVGARVAEQGGSILDVIVASALAANCTDPGVCAPGAGGYITIDFPGRRPLVIDGYMAFPGIGFSGEPFTRTVSMEYGGGVVTNVDAGSVAVPGAFAAFALASERFGAMPWRELMNMVADTVDEGFPLSKTAHTYLLDAGDPIFAQDPISRSALFDKDVLRARGDRVVFVDLAPTLRAIGDEGVGLLYGGDLGAAIANDLSARGGRLTRQDMAEYRAIEREALTGGIAGWQIATNPPPAVGGVAVITALAAIAGSSDPLAPATWFGALRDAFVARITDMERAEDRHAAADHLLRRAGLRSPSTIAVAAVSNEGVSVAASFSAGYGSGVVPKGTGMLMNNSVGEIELLPGGVDTHEPGQRMLSNMAPSVARSKDQAVAFASPGADRITSALTIALARKALGGDDLVNAIDHPRIHPEFTAEGVRAAVEPNLDTSGLEVPVRTYDAPHMYFGGVAGAALEGGRLAAYSDPRRVGAVALIG